MTEEIQPANQMSMKKEALSNIMGNRRIRQLGKNMVEAIAARNPRNKTAKKIKEEFSEMGINSPKDLRNLTKKEDLQFGNNAVLYTTAVASFVEKELRSDLVTMEVIKDLTLPAGADSVKIPKGNNMTATAVSSDGTVSDSSTDYGTKSIQTDLYGARDVVTHELLQVTQIDVLADRLEEIGRSLALKKDNVINAEFQDATDPTGTYGDLGNYNYLGVSSVLTYDNFIQAYHDSIALNMKPTHVVAGTDIMSELEKNDEFSDAAQYATTEAGDFVPQVMTFKNMTVLESANVAPDSLFIIDSNKLGYFVESDGVETWDDRINNKAAFEILGVQRFGVGLARPKAIYGLHQEEDTPT